MAAPRITGPVRLPRAVVGTAYSATFTATSGSTPYRWTATGVPGGLTLTTGGVLSGTPTTAGTFSLNITVTDALGQKTTAQYTLQIAPAGSPLLVVNDDRFASSMNWPAFLARNGIVENRPISGASNDSGKPVNTWEQQGYKRSHVRIQEGALCLEATQDAMTCFDGTPKSYTSGTVQTGGSTSAPTSPAGFSFQYGHLEFDYQTRFRGFEGQGKGRGLWAELRMEGRQGNTFGWPPELDVMDHLGDVGVISTGVKLSQSFNDGTPIDVRAMTQPVPGPILFSKVVDLPLAANPSQATPTRFDTWGVKEQADALVNYLNNNANLPDGPSPLVHTLLRIAPRTTMHDDPTNPGTPTNRTQIRVEGGVGGEMNLSSYKNITIDGGATPGSHGSNGAQLVSLTKTPYQAKCSNALGKTAVDGKTTSVDNILELPAAELDPAMVGARLDLDPNREYGLTALTWSAAAGGTLTGTCAIPHGMAAGTRVEIVRVAPDAYNLALLVSTVPTPTTFTFAGFGANPGVANVSSAALSFMVNHRTVVSVDPDLKHLTYSGGHLGAFGDPNDPVVEHQGKIRWTTLPSIVPDNSDPDYPPQFRGTWDVVYLFNNAVVASFQGSSGGTASTKATGRASDTSRTRTFFQGNKIANARFINMGFEGSFPGGAYDPNYEAQDGFVWKGCTDIEVGNCEILGQWGNGMETFPYIEGDGSLTATIGLWLHDSRLYRFGRQNCSWQYGGNIIVEHNILSGSARTLMDCEPVEHFTQVDPRLTALVDGVFVYYNDIGHHGIGGIISFHAGCANIRIKGNVGLNIGSGSTWTAENVIVEDNVDTGGDYDYGYVVDHEWRGQSDSLMPAFGGRNLAVRNNKINARVAIARLAQSGETRVGQGMAGKNTATDFTGTQTLLVEPTAVVETSGYLPAGRLFIGLDADYRTWIDYTSVDDRGFHGCTGGGLARTLQWADANSSTPIRGINGPTNYTSTGNTGSGTPLQFKDENDVDWATYGGPGHGPGVYNSAWEAAVEPRPHIFRDAQWHTAEMDWDATKITFKIDGSLIWSYTGTHVPKMPLYLIFQLAVLGANPNGWPPLNAGDWEFGAELRVDRLVVLQPVANPPPAITGPASLPAGTVGAPYPPATMTANNGTTPYTWSASSRPPGITINPNTGVISGTPTAAGTYGMVVTLTDSAGLSASRAYAFTINAPPSPTITTTSPLPAGQVGVAYSATMAATGGTPPYTWGAAALPAGLTIDAAGHITGTPTAAGTTAPGITVTDALGQGDGGAFSITIAPAPPLVVSTPTSLPGGQVGTAYPTRQMAATGGVAPYTWAASGLPPGVTCSSSGRIAGTPTVAGTYSPIVTARDAQGTLATHAYSVTIVGAPVAVHITGPGDLPDGMQGRPWPSTPILAAGGASPYSWSASGLPPGLAVNAVTGVVSGTPTSAGSYTPTITVTDAGAATDAVSYAMTIVAPLAVSAPSSVPVGVRGQNYPTTGFAATGGMLPRSWAASGLPAGLTVSPAGVLAGRPTVAGVFPIAVTVMDALGFTTSRNYTLTVLEPLTIAGPATLADGIADQAYASTTINAAGGQGPYAWAATGLPAGLTISGASGTISGTVTVPGTYAVTVTVTDAAARTASQDYVLTVQGGKPPSFELPSLAGAWFETFGRRAGGGRA